MTGSLACRRFVPAIGLTADRAGRLRFFRGARLLAGRGAAPFISGFVVWLRELAGRPFVLLALVVFLVVFVVVRVFAVFLDGGLLALARSRVGGLRRGGARLAA